MPIGMLVTDYVLEVSNLCQTGEVEQGTYFQKLIGSVKTDVVLKDVSMEVRGGEVMAILGSKGSGKRTLLDSIARRAQGPRRGQVTLNGVPMTLQLFQESCGYVGHKADLLPGLTVLQTLTYASNLTLGIRDETLHRSRLRQVLADLALTQQHGRDVKDLSPSEYKRLVIGTQLIRDPVVLLLDEPTWELDPLNTYFIVTILSNHAKKYGRIVVLSMEKPRSDIFAFLDRVTYLSLGEVVYSGGSTQMMLHYFRDIGFPCPELENPLMYYLCLSTVDRRSKERFIESNAQIAALVEQFKMDGGPYRKFASPQPEGEQLHRKAPLSAYGKPSWGTVFGTLVRRTLRHTFRLKTTGLKNMFNQIFLLPIWFFLIWLFVFRLEDSQRSFVTRNGLLLNCMASVTFLSAAVTAVTFAPHRTRYFQESWEGQYRSITFLISYHLCSVPLSFLSVTTASAIIYWGCGLRSDSYQHFLVFTASLWACYLFVEQQTISLMLLVKSSFRTASFLIAVNALCIVVASGTVRTLVGLPQWLYYGSYITLYRYTGAVLNDNEFRDSLSYLPSVTGTRNVSCSANNAEYGCRYMDGMKYLLERYNDGTLGNPNDLDFKINFGVSWLFYCVMFIVNLIEYNFPLPAFHKAKFRE